MRFGGLSFGLALAIVSSPIPPFIATHSYESPGPSSFEIEALAVPALPYHSTFDPPDSARLDAGLGHVFQEPIPGVSFVGLGISTQDLKSIHLAEFPSLYRQGLLAAIGFLENRLRLQSAILNPTEQEKDDREILVSVLQFTRPLLDRGPEQFGLFCARVVSQKNYLLEFATSKRVALSGELVEATYRDHRKLGEVLFVMGYGHVRPGKDLDEYQARLRGIRGRLFGDDILADDIQAVLREIVFIDNMGAFYHDANNLLTGILGMLDYVKEGLPAALQNAADRLLKGPVADLVQRGVWLRQLDSKYRLDRRASQFNAMRQDAELAEAQFARFQQTLKNPEISRALGFIRRSLTPEQARDLSFLPDMERMTRRMILLGYYADSFQNILAHRHYRGDTAPISVAETIRMVRGSIDPELLRIHLREASMGVTIQAYLPHIARIWQNLFINSQDAGASQVRVTISQRKDRAIVRVSDNGKGIPANDLPRIYQPGYSGKGSTGIGLAIARRIALAIGGTIKVKSTVGKGTTFVFSWPLAGSA